MHLRRNIILAAAGLVLVFSAIAGAQSKPMQSMMPDSLQVEHHAAMLRDSLNLSDTQAQQIHGILVNEQQQLMADHEKYAGKTKSFQKARWDLHKNTDKQIMNVLNTDQQKKYQQLQKEMHKSGWKSRKPDHGSMQK